MQVLNFVHFLAISLNNISRYIEDDFSSLSSVNKGKGTVESKRICSEIFFLLVNSEDYILKQVSKITSLLCLLFFSLKKTSMPGNLATLNESFSYL